MSVKVFYDTGSLYVEGREPYPPRSLTATISGTRIQVATLSNMMIANLEFGEYATKAGATFTTAALAKAYLDGEFAKYPPAPLTQMGDVTVSETASVALSVGMKRMALTLNGIKVGDKLMLAANGLATAGCEAINVYASAANQVTVSYYTPAIAILASYSIPITVLKVN